MNGHQWAPSLSTFLVAWIPLVLGAGVPLVSSARPFRSATVVAYAALALSLGVSVLAGFSDGDDVGPAGLSGLLAHVVRVDVVTRVMLVLVSFIGVVVVRYSRTYLRGAPGQPRYARALLVALVAVTVLISSENLLVIAVAWIGTSLALHQLLTFYRERPQALIAAHKKFLTSRLADGCMLGALVLIRAAVGSLELTAVNEWSTSTPRLPVGMQLAALLLVLAVLLKSAQLPFHGWLIQVMEAPTPVSALLHAGVVNIGGFLMIRLAPLMGVATLAQTVLVLAGTITTVLAVLVMSTRITVKVALAWSTCAQMGFMLVECGLGAWHTALLHLVAHSLYKAHAFLVSGTAVESWRVHALLGPRAFARVVASGPRAGARAVIGVVLRIAFAGALYAVGHAVAGRALPPPRSWTTSLEWLIVATGVTALFAVQLLFAWRPEGRLTGALARRLFAGFYLDEIFTRLTFRLWPPRRPSAEPSVVPVAEQTLVLR